MNPRRLLIGAILFVMGTAVYLMSSGAPLRVHLVTLTTELALAAVTTYFSSAVSMAGRRRLIGMLVGLTVVSLLATWLSSQVVAAFRPPDIRHFATGLAATLLKAALYGGAIWIIDFATGAFRRGIVQ